VPLPWFGTAPPFGFTSGAARPWLPQPAHWRGVTAEAQETDPGSVLRLCRAALAARRAHPALGDGTLTWSPSPSGVLSFTREPGFACVVNLSARPCELPGGRVLVSSEPVTGGLLPPDAAVWLVRD